MFGVCCCAEDKVNDTAENVQIVSDEHSPANAVAVSSEAAHADRRLFSQTVSDEASPAPMASPLLPSPAASTFMVTLRKEEGINVGLTLDLLDGVHALITLVKAEGAAGKWNKAAPLEQQIKDGDRIIKVNGVEGNAKEIAKEVANNTELSMVLRRKCAEFEVTIQKRAEEPLGLDLDFIPNSSLVIQRLVDASPAAQWNAEADRKGQRTVKQRDRIVGVNSTRGQPGELLALIKNQASITLTIAPGD